MAFTDPHTRIERLAQRMQPEFRKAFLALVAQAKASLPLDTLERMLSRGQFEQAVDVVFKAAGGLGSAWTGAFITSGNEAAAMLNRGFKEIRVAFDVTNQSAVSAMQANQLRLVREFMREQREATRAALLEGIGRGLNPKQQARAFRGSIGLTTHQVGAVNNYRRLLESRDSQALQRALRDKRFDPTVRRAIALDRPLTQAQIDKMVGRYHQRFINHRAVVIARTESLRSVHSGKDEMFRQAIEAGELSEEGLVQEWNTAGGERVRGTHRTMHGQRRLFGQPFLSGGGALLRFPTDPFAPGSETIQCRCSVGTRILLPEEIEELNLVEVGAPG